MLKLKSKQQVPIQILNNRPDIDEIVLIGSVGTGKTVVAAHMVASICYGFPNTEWFAWRKNNTLSRKTLIRTYKKTLSDMNMIEGKHWTWHDMALEIRFSHNGSKISFSEADRTKDRDQMKIKGIDATGNHIDEANELEEDTFEMILSRKGRANAEGQPSVNIITMNPNNGWAKRRYYDKWKNGTLPPNVVVVEFTIEDSWQLSNDVAALYRKAKWWVERYVKNNWNYSDETNSLITSYMWEKATVYSMPESETFDSYIGVDVSDRGRDDTVATLIQNNVIVKQKVLKIPHPEFQSEGEVDERPLSTLYTNELIKFAQQHGFSAKDSKRICIEENSVGVGMRDRMRDRGWNATMYYATNKSRNEIYLKFRDDIRDGNLNVLYDEGDKYDDKTLQRELFAHTVDEANQQEVICNKDAVKKELGYSPDKADSAAIANYCRNGGATQASDSKKRASRVRW